MDADTLANECHETFSSRSPFVTMTPNFIRAHLDVRDGTAVTLKYAEAIEMEA